MWIMIASATTGAILGIAVMLYADRKAKKACQPLRNRAQRLAEENAELQNQLRQKFVQEAYAAGMEEGRKHPYDEAERFARAFADRKIKYALNVNDNEQAV